MAEPTYTVYLDGFPWKEGVSKHIAECIVDSYDGDKNCYMEQDEPE